MAIHSLPVNIATCSLFSTHCLLPVVHIFPLSHSSFLFGVISKTINRYLSMLLPVLSLSFRCLPAVANMFPLLPLLSFPGIISRVMHHYLSISLPVLSLLFICISSVGDIIIFFLFATISSHSPVPCFSAGGSSSG